MREVLHKFLDPLVIEPSHKLFLKYLLWGKAEDDREIAHDRAISFLERFVEENTSLQSLMNWYFTYDNPLLRQEIFGLEFKTPFMVAAGLDKNGRVYKSLASLGLNPEVGTIPRWEYEGNKKPRIKVLPKDLGMINCMGYPSEGVDQIISRLEQKYLPRDKRSYNIILNIGVNKPSFDKDSVLDDLIYTYRKAYGLADIIVFGFSPNTEGALGLLEKTSLCEILDEVNKFKENQAVKKPVLLKLGADMNFGQIDQCLDTALAYNIDGVVCVNTTVDQNIKKAVGAENIPGGYSGKNLRSKSLIASRHIFKHTERKLAIFACGGIKTGLDCFKALAYGGARGFQFLTYFVNGETSTLNFAYNMGYDLAKLLKKHGVKNISEVVGAYA